MLNAGSRPQPKRSLEIRNPKHEIRNEFKIQNTNVQNVLFRLPKDGGEDPHQLAALLDETVALGA